MIKMGRPFCMDSCVPQYLSWLGLICDDPFCAQLWKVRALTSINGECFFAIEYANEFRGKFAFALSDCLFALRKGASDTSLKRSREVARKGKCDLRKKRGRAQRDEKTSPESKKDRIRSLISLAIFYFLPEMLRPFMLKAPLQCWGG